MPHKHSRKAHDPSLFDLPPSETARPLPVTISRRNDVGPGKKNSRPGISKSRKRRGEGDDTPRAFKRLMAFANGQRPRSGLEDGSQTLSVASGGSGAASTGLGKQGAPVAPTIKPGERMADFAARVDAALPLGNLGTKSSRNGNDPLGLKVYKTRKEKKMHKLYDQWREEDRKIKEKREEELELAAEQELDNELASGGLGLGNPETGLGSTGKRRKKKQKKGNILDDDGGDPWAELKRMRGEQKAGLRDVVQAPPQLHKPAGKKLTVRGAVVDVGSIPKSAGSLRRREELQEIRTDIVAAYRKAKEQREQKGLARGEQA